MGRWATAAEDHTGWALMSAENRKTEATIRTGSPKFDNRRLDFVPELMTLNFCCDIQMVGSECGVKNMKSMDPSCLVSNGSGCWWWCNGVGDIFLEYFGPLNTNWALFKIYEIYQIISDWFLEHDNLFTLLKWPPHSPDLNPIEHILGCGGTGDSHHGCAANKSAATAWCYHVNMDQNLWEMFPTPCWIYATKN